MKWLNHARSILILVSKRLVAQPGMALAIIFGLIISISQTMSIPIYADAVYLRLFRENVLAPKEKKDESRRQPPLSFLFAYDGSLYGEKQWEEIQPADQYFSSGRASAELKLRPLSTARYFLTAPFNLFPGSTSVFSTTQKGLEWASFASAPDIEHHITLIEGNFPEPSVPATGASVQVLVSKVLADKLGLHPGEELIAFKRDNNRHNSQGIAQIRVQIAGIWQANDPEENYWVYGPEFLEKRLLVSEAIFKQQISPALDHEIYLAMWYFVMEDASFHYQDAAPLIQRTTAVERQADMLLPNTRLRISPISALQAYRQNASLLTLQLYAFSLPLLGLLLAFVGLTGSLYVDQRRNEIAVIRSRGATRTQVVTIALLEGLFLVSIGLGISLPLSLGTSRLIGQARKFLDFSSSIKLPVSLTPTALMFCLVAAGLALVFLVLPTQAASWHTVITYKQERARALGKPGWQRAGLDFLLFIPTAYAVYQLRKQGSIDAFGTHDPYENPLLLLVPALVIFSVNLFFLRIMPVIMSALAAAAARTGSVSFLTAARRLARSPGFYLTPLMLLSFTLSLSTFTASLADTVDRHLHEQVYYQVGGDIRFLDTGEQTSTGSQFPNAVGESQKIPDSSLITSRWLFLPISEYLQVPGVKAVAQAGRYTATTSWNGDRQVGVFLGVNRVDFPRVAYWRTDFASSSLGALMNRLALTPNGVLIPYSTMGQFGLKESDTIQVKVNTYGQNNDLELKIVGGFDLFPTWFPEQGPLFVGNLDHLFEQAGSPFPYQVWVKASPNTDPRQLSDQIVAAIGIAGAGSEAAQPIIDEEMQRPERQGLFGVLSVGYIAAALLTVTGFLLYAVFSFSRQYVEFGILRANGLSTGQMAAILAWELVFLILMGGGLGTGLGIGVSKLFIPFLQIGDGIGARIPPYVVEIPWPAILRIYGLFTLLFITALAVLIILLRQMKIFKALKLGEAV